MKKSILLLLLTVVIVSCQQNNPTPQPPTATPSSGIYGDWYWYKMDVVSYNSSGVETQRNSSNYPQIAHVHTYNADGFIYAQGSTTTIGEHSNSNLVKYYNQNNIEFHVTELTATTMVMKQNPNGCNNCSSLEYFFKRP